MPHRPPAAPLPVALLALLLLLSPACTSVPGGRLTPYDDALRQVNLRRGNLGWDGLYVGMTRDQVERTIGQRLGGVQPRSEDDPVCADRYDAGVAYLDNRLDLSFDGSTQSARLLSITLFLPPGFSARDVAGRLKQAIRRLEWVPSRHAPNLPEEQVAKPLYRAPGGGLVFVNPERGVSLGEVCVD